jgi:integrase
LAHRAARLAKAAAAKTFFEVAELFIREMQAKGRDTKTLAQTSVWLLGRSLKGKRAQVNYCAPLHSMLLGDIASADVIRVLDPIWKAGKGETGSRLRGKIEQVLAFGAVRGLAGEGAKDKPNVARWKGNLEFALAAKADVAKVEHHASVPYAELPAFMAELGKRGGVAARALEFAILTAARSGEVRGATAGEFDLKAKTWTVPAERMKAERAHIVPLTDRALAIVAEAIKDAKPEAVAFPGLRGKPMSDMTLAAVLRRMSVDATAHGFRSSFRTWVAEKTNFPGEVAEAALAHISGDKVEAAYQRGTMLEKRRQLMRAWTAYCEGAGAENIVRLSR